MRTQTWALYNFCFHRYFLHWVPFILVQVYWYITTQFCIKEDINLKSNQATKINELKRSTTFSQDNHIYCCLKGLGLNFVFSLCGFLTHAPRALGMLVSVNIALSHVNCFWDGIDPSWLSKIMQCLYNFYVSVSYKELTLLWLQWYSYLPRIMTFFV